MLDELWNHAQSPRFAPHERAVLAAAVAITREPRALPDPVWEQLREHFDDGQIVEIVCVIGLFNYFNRVNNALQIELTTKGAAMERDFNRVADGIEDDPHHDVAESATEPAQTDESSRIDEDMESIAESQEGNVER